MQILTLITVTSARSEAFGKKRGLHLNQDGNTVFTSNLLRAIRNFWNNNNDFVCNDSLLNVNCNENKIQQQTKSINVDEIGKNIQSDVTELSRLFEKSYDWFSKYISF